jgi:hypothetical protein
VLVLCALLVAAEPARVLVVPADEASAARVDEVYAGLRAAGLQVVDYEERAGVDLPAGPPARLGARDDARDLLQEARARFRELDLPAARTAVDAAVDELLRIERPSEALDLLSEALLLRAHVITSAGGDADSDLVLLARLDPARTGLHPGLYPPSLVDAYAAARAHAGSGATGIIDVRARVARFATPIVEIDGVAQPPIVGALQVLRGPHLLVVRAERVLPYARIIDVGDDPVVVSPFLEGGDASSRRVALVDAARVAADPVVRAAALADLGALCAARSVVFLAEPPALLHAGALRPLDVPPGASGAEVGAAVLAALQVPVRGNRAAPVEEPLSLAVLGALAGGVVLLGGAAVLVTWSLLPPTPPPKPPRPVVISCCVD